MELGISQAQFARRIGVDRSTVSQLLGGVEPRLPNGQVVAEAASVLGVSGDWLLGLSDRREPAAQLLASALDMPEAPRAMVDDVVMGWHAEAQGAKIRHVPSTLPTILKTRDFIRWEYDTTLSRDPQVAIESVQERLAMIQESRSDYEIAFPVTELTSFVAREGYYKDLPAKVRDGQLHRFQALHEQFYPSIRIYLYDARQVYSAPMTVFGSILGIIYLGRHYLAFRDVERVAALSQQFDWLVRSAQVSAHDWPKQLRQL